MMGTCDMTGLLAFHEEAMCFREKPHDATAALVVSPKNDNNDHLEGGEYTQ